MTSVKDYSEIRQAAQLLVGLMGAAQPQAVVAPAPGEPTSPGASATRSDQLEHVLTLLCQRGGFTGAIIADAHGLQLAGFNTPLRGDALAAFTTVLGGAIEKAATLLQEHDANNISLDINYTDKLVLRRFRIGELAAYLMILCPQHVDERSEIELSIDEVIRVLR